MAVITLCFSSPLWSSLPATAQQNGPPLAVTLSVLTDGIPRKIPAVRTGTGWHPLFFGTTEPVQAITARGLKFPENTKMQLRHRAYVTLMAPERDQRISLQGLLETKSEWVDLSPLPSSPSDEPSTGAQSRAWSIPKQSRISFENTFPSYSPTPPWGPERVIQALQTLANRKNWLPEKTDAWTEIATRCTSAMQFPCTLTSGQVDFRLIQETAGAPGSRPEILAEISTQVPEGCCPTWSCQDLRTPDGVNILPDFFLPPKIYQSPSE